MLAGGSTVNTTCDAAAAVIANAVLTTFGTPLSAAVNVSPVPVRFTCKSANVATPPVTVSLNNGCAADDSVPLPCSVNATDEVLSVVTTFPFASCSVTVTVAPMFTPATVDAGGSTVNEIDATAPGTMLNAFVAALATPVELAVNTYPVPVFVTAMFPNVAIPVVEFVACGFVPVSAPLPGFVVIASETDADEPVIAFPYVSSSSTWIDASAVPAAVLLPAAGCATMASLFADACVTAMLVLVAVVNPDDVAFNW